MRGIEKLVLGVVTAIVLASSVPVIYQNFKRRAEDKRQSQQTETVADTATYRNVTIDSLIASPDTSTNNYDYSMQGATGANDLVTAKLASQQPQKDTLQPIMYKGVEVDSLRKFPNAKLIGVSEYPIEFRYGTSEIMTYNAKGLLFELDKSTINIIGPLAPFYVGQRYNISYHPFKKGVDVSSQNVLYMFMSGEKEFHEVINTTISEEFDGVLVGNNLDRREPEAKR